MPLEYPYCTLEDVRKETLNEAATDAAWMEQCINQASRMVDTYCHTDFLPHSYDQSTPLDVEPDWILGDAIVFPWPIREITSITEDGGVLDGSTWRFKPKGKILYKQQPNWKSDKFKIHQTIIGVFGYTPETVDPTTKPPIDVPAAVRRATAITASAISGLMQKEQISAEGEKVTVIDTRIPEEARVILKPHKRPIDL